MVVDLLRNAVYEDDRLTYLLSIRPPPASVSCAYHTLGFVPNISSTAFFEDITCFENQLTKTEIWHDADMWLKTCPQVYLGSVRSGTTQIYVRTWIVTHI